MTRIDVQRTISAAPDRVFEWLTDPVHLTAAPLTLRAGWTPGSVPGPGAVRKVVAAGMWLDEEITAYDAPRSYSYLITRSFPALRHDGGTVTCTPTGTGTHVDWSTAYSHPARVGGRFLEAITSRAIQSSFVAILAGCADALER